MESHHTYPALISNWQEKKEIQGDRKYSKPQTVGTWQGFIL